MAQRDIKSYFTPAFTYRPSKTVDAIEKLGPKNIIENVKPKKCKQKSVHQYGVPTRGPRDDSKIRNDFWQYCNVLSSKKRLNPLIHATFENCRLFFIWRSTPLRATELDFCLTMPAERRWCGDAGEVMTFLFFIFWRSTSLRATFQRLLPGEVVISKSKTSCGPRHDCQHAMWPPEAHEFDNLALVYAT